MKEEKEERKNNNRLHPSDSTLFVILNWGLVSLMMACFGMILNQLTSMLYPSWELSGFSFIAFLIAFESLTTHRFRQKSTTLTNPITALLTEIIMIMLSLKIIAMILQGWKQIWPEIISWQRQFLLNFFDSDYLLLLVGGLTIWLVARIFSQPLTQLEEDEALMAQEKLGHTFNDRYEARKKLITWIFAIGCLMMMLLLVMNSSLIAISENNVPPGHLLTPLIIYFAAGFIVISLNQFLIMKARWYFNNMTVTPGLSIRWLFASVIFILMTVLLVTFLPTGFIPDFFPVIQFLSSALVFLYGIVQVIIIIPIVLLISVINAIFSGERINEQVQESMPDFLPQVNESVGNVPLAEGLKSLFFWIVFIAIIFLTLRYYFKNHIHFQSFFQKFHLKAWLSRFWQWFKNGFQKTGHAIGETIKTGVNQIQTLIKKSTVKFPNIRNLTHRLPPRQALILLYMDWIQWNHKKGLQRAGWHTPNEYAALCQAADPACGEAIQNLTSLFIKARYTRSPIAPSEVKNAQETLTKLKNHFLTNEREQVTLP